MASKPKFSEKRQNVILVQDRISTTSKRSLRPALRARRITPYSRNVRPFPERSVFINFGGGELPCEVRGTDIVLNPPDKVAISSNKLRTFELLKAANVPSVRWSVELDTVREWLGKGHKTLARTNLSSSGGRGIKLISSVQDLDGFQGAPLYTRYFPKTHEFRVHVVDGVAIDITEKKLREQLKGNRNDVSVVRSHGNGWVHAHSNLSLSDPVDLGTLNLLATDAIRAIGLDFGAVDVLACLDSGSPRRLSKAVVCEVNSAPGIENTITLEAYTKAFNTLIEKRI